MSVVLTISDTHAPYHNADALDFLSKLKKEFKPTDIIHLGDEIDAHAWSSFAPDPDALSAGDELKKAIKFMKGLYKLFPVAKVCIGNHTERAVKKAKKVGLPAAFIRHISEVLEAPKDWHWADYHHVDDIVFMHGEGYCSQDAAIRLALLNGKNTVIGHIHSAAGVQYTASQFRCLWGASSGCLIDPSSLAMAYGKHTPRKAVLGTTIVVDGTPMFMQMKR
jgi:predicted phosphodiesterase